MARCNAVTGRGSSGGTRVASRPSSSGSSSSSGVSPEMMKELKRLRRETARLKKVEEEKNDRLRQRIAELEKKEKARLLALEADRRREKERSSQKVSASVIESASGFFVSRFGHVITNEHVVKSCRKVTVGNSPRTQVVAKVIEMDGRNDLALLKVASLKTASVETRSLIQKLSIRIVPLASGGLLRSDEVALGEDVLVAGYPYGDLSLVGEGIKVTKGIISANRGLGGDVGQFQIDAAVQPGNSGGPIYDSRGNIIGVVVAQLNKLKFAEQSGSMPENVNFGIKASAVRQFLTTSGLPTKWSTRSKPMSTQARAKIAKRQTLMVKCHK